MINIIEIVQQRLARQSITQPQDATPAQIVARLGAMQAQEYASAGWAVGLRINGATATQIEAAVAQQQIVRTWPLRGTLHFVAREDLDWLLRLTAPGMIAGNARRYQELELDAATLRRGVDLIVQTLGDGIPRARAPLMAALNAAGIHTDGQRAAYLLQRAALEGLICRGANDGSSAPYCLVTPAAAPPKIFSEDEALAELAWRYFAGHGPATLQDFVWWSGLKVGQARAGLAAVQARLAQAPHTDQTYYWAEDSAVIASSAKRVDLLPGFDEYYLGYRDRAAVIDPQYATRVVPGGNGIFKPMVVVDGRVQGIWKRTVKKGKVQIAVEGFTPFAPEVVAALPDAANRFGAYLGLAAEVQGVTA